jgi:hypothetical protein
MELFRYKLVVDFTRKHYAKYAPSWAGRVVLSALEGRKTESGKKVEWPKKAEKR